MQRSQRWITIDAPVARARLAASTVHTSTPSREVTSGSAGAISDDSEPEMALSKTRGRAPRIRSSTPARIASSSASVSSLLPSICASQTPPSKEQTDGDNDKL
jgi:hypothetical protein